MSSSLFVAKSAGYCCFVVVRAGVQQVHARPLGQRLQVGGNLGTRTARGRRDDAADARLPGGRQLRSSSSRRPASGRREDPAASGLPARRRPPPVAEMLVHQCRAGDGAGIDVAGNRADDGAARCGQRAGLRGRAGGEPAGRLRTAARSRGRRPPRARPSAAADSTVSSAGFAIKSSSDSAFDP